MGRQPGYTWPYRPTKPYRMASGEAVRIVIYLDDETYADIDRGARAGDCSLSSQARMLIEVGLETLAAEDRREAATNEN